MKVALFLVAGASVPYGMPTTRELRNKLRQGGLDFPRRDLLDSDQFPDIEHVLSVLDQLLNFICSRAGHLYARYANEAPTSKAYTPAAYRLSVERFKTYVDSSYASKEIIEQLITKHYQWDPSNNDIAEKILRPLFDIVRSKDSHVTVFTTNYDTVIEEYCGNPDRHIERIDGFKLHPARHTHAWDGKFAPQYDDFHTKVLLYKLHGSMNWLADDSGDRRIILQKPDTGASDDRARDMYIRPSLDAKDEATQNEPYATILGQFEQLLPSFDACIVIGYSFRDPHISGKLVKFVKSGKVLIVLSPTAAADFANNALKGEPASSTTGGWKSKRRLRSMTLSSNGRMGIVYALNVKLDKDSMDSTIDTIKSAIRDCSFSLESEAAEPQT